MTTDPRSIEARLRAAADAATWPATPDLRSVVQSRIEAATPDLRGPVLDRIAGTRPAPPPRLVRRPLVRGLALALVAVVAVAGVAAALGYRLPGLDIVFVETLPPAGTALDLGSSVPIDEVLPGERPRVLLPAALPRPTTAWVAGAADRTIVSLAWRAEPGQQALDDSDLSLVLMAVPGTADREILAKSLGPDTSIETVSVNGDRGWWISGGAHALLFLRPDGDAGQLPTRLAGDTLVFSRDGTLYRFESALGRDATLAIAESLP